MNIEALTSELQKDDLGIWRGSAQTPLSYPDMGNEQCYQLEDSSFWFKHRNECIAAVIRHFPPKGPILDIGGGNGYVSQKIQREGFETILLEPGSTGAYNAKTNRKIPHVICSTLDEANFPDNALAASGCFDVIEHIEDDRSFILEIHRLLAPDGLLYATVPAHQYLWSQSDVEACHFRRYNKLMLLDLLGKEFELIYHTYFFTVLSPLILLFRTLPFRLGFGRKDNVLSTEAEHGSRHGVAQKVIEFFLQKELNKIKKDVEICKGASCLFVAKKKAC